jgi:gliding motility-associated-like protein
MWVMTGRSAFINNQWDMCLFRLDNAGGLISADFYDAGTSDGEAGRAMLVKNDHSVVISGDVGTFDERNMFLASINQNGNVNWSKQYPVSVLFTNYPYDVAALRGDSGYVFTGDLRPPATLRNAALFRTDAAGDAGCLTDTLMLTLRTDTVESIPVTLSESVFVLTENSVTWQDMNKVIAENTICQFPNADFSYTADTICPLICLNFRDESVNATSWQWTFEGGDPGTSALQNPPQVCYDGYGSYAVKLVVTDGALTDSVVRQLVLSEFCDTAIIIPNVITPNGDFVNDQFEIKNLPENFKLSIFNRWGNVLFETSDRNKLWPEKRAGNHLHDGVYYYVLDTFGPGKNQSFHGTLSVLMAR